MEIYTVSQDHLWIQRRWRLKERERNLVSAMLGIFVIAILAIALSQPRWFILKGGGCSQKYLGMQQFFSFGQFKTESSVISLDGSKSHSPSLVYITSDNMAMSNCVTPKIVGLMKTNIVLCLGAIACSLVQFLWDSLGLRSKKALMLRRSAVGSTTTVILCVASIGICYYTSTLMEFQQNQTRSNLGTRTEIKFDISYYLITAAGAFAILTAASNLLKQYPLIHESDGMEDNLLDDHDGNETFSIGNTQCQLWPCRSNSLRGTVPPVNMNSSVNFSGVLPASANFQHGPPPPYIP